MIKSNIMWIFTRGKQFPWCGIKPWPTIPCSGEKFPVPIKRIPCFRKEQGNDCKLLNGLGEQVSKPLKEEVPNRFGFVRPLGYPVSRNQPTVPSCPTPHIAFFGA
jgi:hypothetical protein